MPAPSDNVCFSGKIGSKGRTVKMTLFDPKQTFGGFVFPCALLTQRLSSNPINIAARSQHGHWLLRSFSQ
jgi:hypothetical protein